MLEPIDQTEIDTEIKLNIGNKILGMFDNSKPIEFR